MKRRWLTVTGLFAATALALTGCGLPGGVDGNLVDDWAAAAEPVGFVPEAGICHPTFEDVGHLHAYRPVDCTQAHAIETVHVGTFTGSDGAGTAPPETGSTGMRTARADCEKRINELLGAPWRSGPMDVAVVPPSEAAWTGGARWYRCDAGQLRGLREDGYLTRTGTLKGALGDSSELLYGCFEPKVSNDLIEDMKQVPCTTKHRSEFVGIWNAPDSSYTAFDRNTDRPHSECRKLVAKFAKIPNDSDLEYRVGTIFFQPTESEWEDGSRGVQCFLWNSEKQFTRSMKGAGTNGFPINYA